MPRPATWGQAPKGWTTLCADICWEDHGGTWCKRDRSSSLKSKRAYYVLRFTCTDDWGDDDISKPGKYEAATGWIDLDDVKEETLKSALDYIGYERDPDGGIWAPGSGRAVTTKNDRATDLVLVEALAAYGAVDWEYGYGNAPWKLRAQAARGC